MTDPAPHPAAEPPAPRRTRRGLVIGIVVAAVILAGVGIAAWVLTRPPSVEDAAEQYLTALSEGDYATISGMLAPGGDAAGEGTLADAFAGATYGASPEIEEITPGDDMTGVRASMELAGDRRTVYFGLGLRDGRWLLTADYLASLDATTTIGNAVWVGEALVPVGSVALLPAVYPVAPAPQGILVGGTEVAVSNDEQATVAVEATPAEDVAAQAQVRLDVYLDQCTVAATSLPDSCGIRIPWAADLAALDGLAYRIEQRPAIALSPADGAFAATGGILVATARGTTHDGVPGEFTYRAEDWALYGTVSFSGDEMLLAVR